MMKHNSHYWRWTPEAGPTQIEYEGEMPEWISYLPTGEHTNKPFKGTILARRERRDADGTICIVFSEDEPPESAWEQIVEIERERQQ